MNNLFLAFWFLKLFTNPCIEPGEQIVIYTWLHRVVHKIVLSGRHTLYFDLQLLPIHKELINRRKLNFHWKF